MATPMFKGQRPTAEDGDDDDIGAMFRARHQAQQEKRAKNMEHSTAELVKAGVHFTAHNSGAHLIVQDKWDFWPSTGRFIERKGQPGKPKRQGRGVRNLMKLLEVVHAD